MEELASASPISGAPYDGRASFSFFCSLESKWSLSVQIQLGTRKGSLTLNAGSVAKFCSDPDDVSSINMLGLTGCMLDLLIY